MVKQHLKRMSAPKTWPIYRKFTTFVTRPFPGGQKLENSLSLGTVLKELLGHADTNREARMILHHKEVLVDGAKRTNLRTPVGLFDAISLPDLKKHHRLTLSSRGRLTFIQIDEKEAKLKPCAIRDKNLVGGKVQLNLSDGRNILVDKDDYKTSETLVLAVPAQEIKERLKLEKGAMIFLTGGTHIGRVGTVEDISGDKIMYKTAEGELAESLRKYAFVIGTGGKASVTVTAEAHDGNTAKKTR